MPHPKKDLGKGLVGVIGKQAGIGWAIDAGRDVPKPSTLEAVSAIADYEGWTLGVVEIDPAAIDPTSERVDIILPRRVLRLLMRKLRHMVKAVLAISPIWL